MTEKIKIQSGHERDRIICNNKRLGIESYCLWGSDDLKIINPHSVVQWLAWGGDELSKKIIESFEDTSIYGSRGLPGCVCNLILYSSEVVTKLVLRKMTQQEYADYLTGEKPIGQLDNSPYFIIKPQEAIAA